MTPSEFWKHVDRSGGPDACWPWQMGADKLGYGRLRLGRRVERAHRVALFLVTGIWPESGCHRCNNPACCNVSPLHLYAGDDLSNSRDRVLSDRQARGEPIARARRKLTLEQAQQVLALVRAGRTNQDVADIFGVSKTCVGFIRTGRTWAEQLHGREPHRRVRHEGDTHGTH